MAKNKFSGFIQALPKMTSQPIQTKSASSSLRQTPKEFIILGSGVSTALPRISCLIRPGHEYFCKPCHDAVVNPTGPNRRCNVSALVRLTGKTVLIDCGKTIREAAVRHFPTLGIRNVDSIVLTHGHADAILGLDDSRDIQQDGTATVVNGQTVWTPPDPTPVFLNEETFKVCKNVFPYLIPAPQKEPVRGKKDIQRRVASLQWNVYAEEKYFVPFNPVKDANIEFTPFPMYHGGTYICMGFLIKMREDSQREIVIAYLSDLHALPEKSMTFLDAIPHLDLLVVDLLTRSKKNRSHFNLDQAKDMVRRLKPHKAVAVGMTCSLGMHDEVNEELAQMDKEGYNFRLAYDGMRFAF